MQKEFWEAEYTGLEFLPSSRSMEPSRVLVKFLETHKSLKGKALDIGTGKGRNSIFLAKNGFDVVGADISSNAINMAKQNAQEAEVADKVVFIEHDAGQQFDYQDGSFHLITDLMMLHLLNPEERKTYIKEVVRLIKPGGHYFFFTISVDSPSAQKLFTTSPGPEPNSYIIPQSGMVEKCFSEDDLQAMFKPLEVESLETMADNTPAFGDVYEQLYLVCSMVKPQPKT